MGTVFKRLAVCAVLVGLFVMPALAKKDVASAISAVGGAAGVPGELPNVVWDQITDQGCDLTNGCLWSNNCTTPYEGYTGIAADDFVVPSSGWILDGISVEGAWTSGTVLIEGNWYIYEDTGGSGPGAEVCALEAQATQPGASDQLIVFDASACPELAEGVYWMGYYPTVDCGVGTWCWVGGTSLNGDVAHIYDEGFCGAAWVPQGPSCDEDLVGGYIQDLCFAISATEAPPDPTPATSTVGIAILLVLMAAAGFYFLRRRQTA